MLRVPQHHPGHRLRGSGCCAISERPTPSSFASSSLFSLLSPIIPVHRRHSPVSPIIPAHTQKHGGGGYLFSLSDLPSLVLAARPVPVGLSGACPDPVGMVSPFSRRLSPLATHHSPLACPPQLWRRRATSSGHSRAIGNCCPTDRTHSFIYHYITYPLSARRQFWSAAPWRRFHS